MSVAQTTFAGFQTWDLMSDCNRYRYEIGQRWAPGKLAVFGLCNPSAATKDKTDATATKTCGFASRWGCGGRVIVNPCALRSRSSKALLEAGDPIGRDNAEVWRRVFREAVDTGAPIVFGWGDALPKKLRYAARWMAEAADAVGAQPLCFGFTRSGQPLHPLMLGYARPLVPFEVRP